jgi:hypothetical protein
LCNINVSAEQEKKRGDAYGMNENVLIEIGAALLQLQQKTSFGNRSKIEGQLTEHSSSYHCRFYEVEELSSHKFVPFSIIKRISIANNQTMT